MLSPGIPNADLGALDRLPLELVTQIFYPLDIRSLFKFRQVSLRANQVVASFHEYQILISYGLNVLCALLRTRLGIYVTLFDFYRAIRTKACALCDQFGAFIFLPTWSRCCFECLKHAPETQMEMRDTVQKRFRLTPQESSEIRTFKPLPGVYSKNGYWQVSDTKIASAQRARLILREKTVGDIHAMTKDPLPSIGSSSSYRFMASCTLPFVDPRTGVVEHGISCAGCYSPWQRFGPALEDWVHIARDKIYSHESFLNHFKWCKQAQLLYQSSEDGMIEPIERAEMAG